MPIPKKSKKWNVLEFYTEDERDLLRSFADVDAVQRFLSDVPYSPDAFYRSPRAVMRDRKAHCFDGAVFAAAALEVQGRTPWIIDLGSVRDDDHVLAVFREGKCFGAIGQSNYSTLRWREPVYRSLRELVMSYFDGYFSTSGERSLRSYTAPIDLRRFGAFGWRTKDGAMRRIAGFLTKAKHIPVIDAAQARRLHRVDRRLYAAGSLGADPRGLYDAGAYVDE